MAHVVRCCPRRSGGALSQNRSSWPDTCRVAEQRLPDRLRTFARNRNAQAVYRAARRTDEKLGFAPVAFELSHMVDVHEPVAVHAKHGGTDRRLYRRERKVDVEASPRCVDVRETLGRLKCPHLLHAQKHERTFSTSYDPPHGGSLAGRWQLRCAPQTHAFDALR